MGEGGLEVAREEIELITGEYLPSAPSLPQALMAYPFDSMLLELLRLLVRCLRCPRELAPT
jgi:hypothetical protein